MRELKFRAWQKAHKKMLYRVNLYSLNRTGLIDKAQLDNATFMDTVDLSCIVMQFTGLKDGSGKDIYEGDILGPDYEDKQKPDGYALTRLQVAFQDGSFGWIGDITGKFFSFASDPLEGYEILGNIYENPELLTVNQEQ